MILPVFNDKTQVLIKVMGLSHHVLSVISYLPNNKKNWLIGLILINISKTSLYSPLYGTWSIKTNRI